MRPEGIFINGVYNTVLEEILDVQRWLPEHIMYLQPHRAAPIVHLRDGPPAVDEPVRLFMSITTDLSTIRYAAEIVGWDNKQEISEKKANVINRLIWTLQPNECGLYNSSSVKGKQSINLIHIRRLHKLHKPFPVSELTKTADGLPVSPGRTTSGGWTYVHDRSSE